MGTIFVNEQCPRAFGLAMLVIDRELGSAQNRYSLFLSAPTLSMDMPRQGCAYLYACAQQGRQAWDVSAAQVLVGWLGMTAAHRADTFQVFLDAGNVERWIERHRVSPALHDKGPGLSKAELESLSASAKVSQASFEQACVSILGSWWGSVPLADQGAFYQSFLEW